MQLVPVQNRVFRFLVIVSTSLKLLVIFSILCFYVAPHRTTFLSVSEPQSAKLVNDTVVMRSSSPVTREQPSLTSEASRSSQGIVRLFEITAYSPTVAECDSSPTVTASGQKVRIGGIAADLRVLPFGSLVIIPGYNNDLPCEVIDTGGAIKGLKLDVFFWLSDDARNWGRRKNVPVTILRYGNGVR